MTAPRQIPAALLERLADTAADPRRLEAVVRPLLDLLEEVTGLESTYFTVIDERQGLQTVLHARNTRQLQIPEGLTVPWADTLCRRAIAEGRGFTADVAGCWGDSQAARELGICTYLSEPVRLVNGMLFGTLCAASERRVEVSDSTRHYIALFSDLIARYIESEKLLDILVNENQQLSQHALTDPLTGIPNRRALIQSLERLLGEAAERSTVLHVAFIDLDGFKEINDRFGHDAGDRFLIQIAAALDAGRGEGDVIARYGGDEFVWLCPVAGRDPARQRDALKRQLERLTQGTFQAGDDAIDYGGASVGVITTERDERDSRVVLQRSDTAMYARKQVRKGG